jgi:hypothetical protein
MFLSRECANLVSRDALAERGGDALAEWVGLALR